jgi:hypothetical protein
MPSRYADPTFWVNACDLAFATSAKAIAASIGAEALGLTDASWPFALDVGALAALVSILTSIATAKPTE